MSTLKEQQKALDEALAKLPKKNFRLKEYPDNTFRVNIQNSYYSEKYGVQIYLDRRVGNQWENFAKGTVRDVLNQINREGTLVGGKYYFLPKGNDWKKAPDSNWQIVTVNSSDEILAHEIGERNIDGGPSLVYKSSNGYYAEWHF